MTSFEQILNDSNSTKVHQLYANIRKMTKVEHNKTKYSQNMKNLLQLLDGAHNVEVKDYSGMDSMFLLADYKSIFADFRQTLMNARSKKEKVEKLLKLSKKGQALKQFYNEIGN